MRIPASMDECSFFSKRVLENGTKLTAWIPSGQKYVNVIYDCSNCKHHGEITQEFEKPIAFNCQKCGITINIEPLKKRKGKKKGSA
jgi:peptide subunit release factor 1 (eRF1)